LNDGVVAAQNLDEERDKGATFHKPPIDGGLSSFFDDEEKLTALIAEMKADFAWEVRALREFGAGVGWKNKKETMLAKIASKMTSRG
jgi:hypothetical protein